MIRFLQIIAIYIVIFTQMLDTSIANLALTTISADLHMDVYHASWVMTSFGTGLVISFSLANLLKNYISSDAMLALGCVVFICASYFCGNAQNSGEFLAFRFIQGLSSGLTIVVAQSILLHIMGEENKTFAISLWTSAISLAPVMGPLVGAFITEYLSWRWLFLINVPLMSVSLLLLLNAMTITIQPQTVSHSGKMLTFICFAVFISAMQYTVDFGELYQWFDSPLIQLSFVTMLLACCAFLLSNHYHTLFDLSVFKIAGYGQAVMISAVGNGLIFASLVFLPIWLQNDYGMPMLQAGMIISVASAVAALSTPIIGKYLPSRLYAPASALSLLLTAGSFALMSQFSMDSSHGYLIMSRLVAGFGIAIFSMPLAALALRNINKAQMINANSITITLRILCANLFVTIGFIFAVHQTRYNYAESVSSLDRISILNALSHTSESMYAYQMKLARTEALNHIFVVSAVIFFVFSLIILPIMIKQYMDSRPTKVQVD